MVALRPGGGLRRGGRKDPRGAEGPEHFLQLASPFLELGIAFEQADEADVAGDQRLDSMGAGFIREQLHLGDEFGINGHA